MKSSLRWEQIKNAEYIYGIKYPADFDIENVDFTGRDIGGSDFSLLGQKITGYEPIINDNISSSTGFEPVIIDFK